MQLTAAIVGPAHGLRGEVFLTFAATIRRC